jgi:hypothetical protein
MLGSLLIAIFLLGVLAGGAALAVAQLCRHPNLTVMEVTEFLRAGNPRKIFELLNPQFEDALRATLPRRAFLRQQKKSLLLVLEFLNCMSHSTRICIELADSELQRETDRHPGADGSEDYIEHSLDLHHAAVDFRLYCLAARLKARSWLIFRTQWWLPLAAPRLSQLREMRGLNFAASYNLFVRALADLGRLHGMEFQDAFLQALIKSAPLDDVLRPPRQG